MPLCWIIILWHALYLQSINLSKSNSHFVTEEHCKKAIRENCGVGVTERQKRKYVIHISNSQLQPFSLQMSNLIFR
jgi:hypothetical protein